MRRPSLVTILGAAAALVLAVLTIWVLAGHLSANDQHASIVVSIPDHPEAVKADDAEPVVAALPNAAAPPDAAAPPASQPEPSGSPTEQTARADPAPAAPQPAPVVAEPPPPPNAVIAGTIREKLKDPALRKDAHPDDLAALDAFYTERSDPAALWMTDEGFSTKAKNLIDELGRAEDWGLASGAFAVPSAASASLSAPDALAKAEIELDLAILKYARFAKGGRTTPNTLSKIIDQELKLPDPKVVLIEIAASDARDGYLKSLHPKHEQFQKLRDALIKARQENAKPEDIERIVVNMERWRWMPEELGSRYVQINVPEFMAFVVKDGKTVYEEKVVVGKPVYATPIFSADMTSIVFNPEWTVPPTVIREDLLPHLRKGGGWFSSSSNTAVLKKHKLKVKYHGRTVDPNKIDWKKVNMRAISFVQPPGPTNVLGKVKFLYPNEHAVYMHDTIKKGLMNKEVRVEGHHCPRVANPGKFAGLLIAEDQGMTEEEIDKLMTKGHNSAVDLKTPLPVHTTYFTAAVDGEGKVKTFGDVYKLDVVVAKALGKDLKAVASAPKPASSGGALADSTP